MDPVLVIVSDKIQQDYRYWNTEPVGENFHPEFHPELTPKEMLELSVLGGKYLTDCLEEFPQDWFVNARLNPDRHDPHLNFYGVNASKPLWYWQMKSCIYPEDPRGWFQWYCSYYMGRRCPDDARQIKRWKAMSRHIGQLRKNCRSGDLNCRFRQRQALLHLAFDSSKI